MHHNNAIRATHANFFGHQGLAQASMGVADQGLGVEGRPSATGIPRSRLPVSPRDGSRTPPPRFGRRSELSPEMGHFFSQPAFDGYSLVTMCYVRPIPLPDDKRRDRTGQDRTGVTGQPLK